MSAVVGRAPRATAIPPGIAVRRQPLPGEIGCVGACPLCTVPGKTSPPCLACRDELRARLADMQLGFYLARATN